ncbi:histidine utilization repressor [Govanella unica]|uniref:Histidine utilization repressor n=1 Tax=Govanella unica TaxID=2975056 RepID=A0A9X3Z602_9PROT|nr:histidine utilization repressor [Govania unica]MDA5192424.1 histidine utilization repressor [Govania unica]
MTPLYQQIKNHIREHIGAGTWGPGQRVPSENELVRTLGASRMTVNRALREMTDEGILHRVAGVGTFVADRTAYAHPLEVRNIAEEIRARGHQHSAQVVTLETMRAGGELAGNFGVPPKTNLFHSLILHSENGVPLQIEDRYVNPAVAPDYMSIDFAKTTPYEYLVRVAPLQEAEHVLRAVMPGDSVRKLLGMAEGEPALLLLRRTWSNGVVTSTVRLYYPGSRYELAGRFNP